MPLFSMLSFHSLNMQIQSAVFPQSTNQTYRQTHRQTDRWFMWETCTNTHLHSIVLIESDVAINTKPIFTLLVLELCQELSAPSRHHRAAATDGCRSLADQWILSHVMQHSSSSSLANLYLKPVKHKKPSWRCGWPTVLPPVMYNHAVRIWEVDAVGRQKIVIPSGIGLAAVLAVGHLADWLNCTSVYKLWTVHC